MGKRLVAAFIAACVLAGAAWAVGQEHPKDFRGIAWGTSIDDLDGFKRVTRSGYRDTYYRPGEDLTLYGADVESVAYYFPDGRLTGVGVVFSGEPNHFLIKDALIKRLGPGRQAAVQYGWTWPDFSIAIVRGQGERFALTYRWEPTATDMAEPPRPEMPAPGTDDGPALPLRQAP